MGNPNYRITKNNIDSRKSAPDHWRHSKINFIINQTVVYLLNSTILCLYRLQITKTIKLSMKVECWIKLPWRPPVRFSCRWFKRKILVVSYLFFADDTLIFCDTDLDQMLIIHLVLIWFGVVLGLKINLGKSELVPMGAVHNIELVVAVLGCM